MICRFVYRTVNPTLMGQCDFLQSKSPNLGPGADGSNSRCVARAFVDACRPDEYCSFEFKVDGVAGFDPYTDVRFGRCVSCPDRCASLDPPERINECIARCGNTITCSRLKASHKTDCCGKAAETILHKADLFPSAAPSNSSMSPYRLLLPPPPASSITSQTCVTARANCEEGTECHSIIHDFLGGMFVNFPPESEDWEGDSRDVCADNNLCNAILTNCYTASGHERFPSLDD